MSKNKNKGGLGRGLGALIPTAPAGVGTTLAGSPAAVPNSVSSSVGSEPVAGSAAAPTADTQAVTGPAAPATTPSGVHLAEIPVSAIRANAKQPRQVFDEDALAELTHSIREFGVLQPIVVRPLNANDGDNGDGPRYELVMGERRLRASTAAGLSTVPAIVRSTADEAMLRDALLENIHRAQLNPLEEAAAYQQLLQEFDVTHEELAQRLGRSRPQVSNTIRLLNLPIPVQRRVAAGVLSAGHARALLGLDDSAVQDELAARIVAEGLSVRATEELVALHTSGHLERKSARKAAAPRITAPAASDLADRLSDLFDTKVRVDIGRRKGKVSIEFASIDDLERIVGVMAPQLVQRRGPGATQNEP